MSRATGCASSARAWPPAPASRPDGRREGVCRFDGGGPLVEMLFQRCHAMEQPAPRVLTKFPMGPQVRWPENFGPNRFLQKKRRASKAIHLRPEIPMGPIRQEVPKFLGPKKFSSTSAVPPTAVALPNTSLRLRCARNGPSAACLSGNLNSNQCHRESRLVMHCRSGHTREQRQSPTSPTTSRATRPCAGLR
jgi:hypothetical protein